jgi:hypothetical protein
MMLGKDFFCSGRTTLPPVRKLTDPRRGGQGFDFGDRPCRDARRKLGEQGSEQGSEKSNVKDCGGPGFDLGKQANEDALRELGEAYSEKNGATASRGTGFDLCGPCRLSPGNVLGSFRNWHWLTALKIDNGGGGHA